MKKISTSNYEEIAIKVSIQIAQKVHDEIEKNIGVVKHCMVHVNPI